MSRRSVIRYSESFKLQVVQSIESGRYAPCFQAMRAYGIGGCNTIHNWVRQYGKNHLLNKVIKVEKANEKSENAKLRAKIRRL